MSSNARASKFCQELYHKLGLYVDKQRDNGVSDRAIFRKLEAMESCGISCDGWKKRIEHRDTCIHLGVEPHRLSQTETRKLRRLNKRDKKRVKQAFADRLKNNGELSPKETRRVFKQAFNKVDPIVLKKRRVVPQTTESAEVISLDCVSPPKADSNLITSSVLNHSKVHKRLGEQPPVQLKDSVVRGTQITEAFNSQYTFPPEPCACPKCPSKDYCLSITLYRQEIARKVES